jgi:hypothetical protein
VPTRGRAVARAAEGFEAGIATLSASFNPRWRAPNLLMEQRDSAADLLWRAKRRESLEERAIRDQE